MNENILIINDINISLLKEHKNDENVMSYLEKNNLFDIGHDDEVADRSYSALVKTEEGEYKSLAYCDEMLLLSALELQLLLLLLVSF